MKRKLTLFAVIITAFCQVAMSKNGPPTFPAIYSGPMEGIDNRSIAFEHSYCIPNTGAHLPLEKGNMVSCQPNSNNPFDWITPGADDEVQLETSPVCSFTPTNISMTWQGCFGPWGTYTPSGSANGAPKWSLSQAGWSTELRWTGSQWAFFNVNPSYILASNSGGSITNLPCSGWVENPSVGCGAPTQLTSGCGSLLPPYVTPSVNIAADPGNTITSGTSVTFTATPTNGGGVPSYQWKKNNVNVGSNSATYTNATLANGDIITCVMTSADVCAQPLSATSNSITMNVSTPCVTPTVYNVSGGGSYCSGGTGVAINLSNSQSGVNYQLVLGSNNAGNPASGNGSSISFNNITTAGSYTVVATNTAGSCTAAMSGSATVSVNPIPTGITVLNISACNGANTTCTSDDTYTADISVTYSGIPASGTLNLSGSGIVGMAPSVAYSSLSGNSYTFTGVTLRADGAAIGLTATFSLSGCTFTNNNAGTAPSCSNACSISNISMANASACNSNNSTTAADDYFTANVTVTFAYAPGSGNLTLKRGNLVLSTVAASSLSCVTTYTFNNVQMTADGAAILLSAEFNSCSYTTPSSLGNAPVSCSCTPAMTCPADIVVGSASTTCGTNVTVPLPTVTENCGNSVTLVSSHPATFYPVDTTVVTWSGAGTCTMKVIVIDNRIPNISCPPNQTRVAGPINDLPIPTVLNDNCGIDHYDGRYKFGTNWIAWKRTNNQTGPSPINTNIPNGVPNYVVGSYILQYQAVDLSRNLKVCQFNLTVTAPLTGSPDGNIQRTQTAQGIKAAEENPINNQTLDLHCYPNPFNDQLNISFQLDKASVVHLTILDITGRVAGVISDQPLEAGRYNLPFQANALSDGIYFVRLQADERSIVDKVILIR